MSDNDKIPVVSIIMRSYNRADTIKRTIDSVIAQDFKNFELIVIDDGSTDKSVEISSSFKDSRIRIIRHEKNKGNAAALNTGLDNIHGEWFTLLDSDDEMVVPNALSTLLNLPKEIDPLINAITCNCIDTQTGTFSGLGLDHDQYLDAKEIIQKCRGEHWGLTKTFLLQGDRLNEDLTGMEGFLWYKINKRAKRYYLHRGLRLYHTEGEDRITNIEYQNKRAYNRSIAILNEKEYLEDYRIYGRDSYKDLLFSAAFSFIAYNDKKKAFQVFLKLITLRSGRIRALIIRSGFIFVKTFFEQLRKFKRQNFHFKIK
jgi:GalNAc5-diNAcBac-PP-undecaprenol beta-1,3-glucosyltransferase